MSNPGINRDLIPQFTPERASPEASRLLERFQATSTKIAIQKDGALTDIARSILLDTYGICVPATPKGRVPVSISEDGETGFIYARNKGICNLVTEGAADMAIVGTDRLIEDGVDDRVDIITSYREQYSWSLVLATALDTSITQASEISRVATQYPIIARRYFESIGREDVEIVPTSGNTELYPYLKYGDKPIDAVIDLTSTGETLMAHNLTPWTPSIGDIYPVLIQARSENNSSAK